MDVTIKYKCTLALMLDFFQPVNAHLDHQFLLETPFLPRYDPEDLNHGGTKQELLALNSSWIFSLV